MTTAVGVKDRLGRMRQELAAAKLDAFITGTIMNMRYLTGFTGSAGYLVVAQDGATLFVDGRYTEQAESQFTAGQVRTTERDILAGAMRALTSGQAPARLGFESRVLPHEQWRRLADTLGSATELVPTQDVVERLRGRKDAQEVDAIRRAIAITDRAYQDFLTWVKPGMIESEVAARCEYFQRGQGAERKETRTAVGSGPRSSMPHCIAADRTLRANEPVMLDIGCTVDGYTSDLTRTVFLGTPPKEFEAMYAAVGEAQRLAIAAIKPGIAGRAVHEIARNHLIERGFPELPHSLGHSLGLNIHERPSFSAVETAAIEVGNVITVEPGIYLTGRYGLRTEDVIVVTQNGCEVLSKQESALQVL
jgi:Xaa-Pro aminopeptidase